MKNTNVFTFSGKLGADPEPRYTQGGTLTLSFSVANSDDYRKDDEWVQKTNWFRVTAYGKSAEYLIDKYHKGDNVIVVCRVSTSERDGEDGKRVYSTFYNLTSIEKVWPSRNEQSSGNNSHVDNSSADHGDEDDDGDDIPF